MAEDETKLPKSLISIEDIFGVSKPLIRVIDAIEKGIGACATPILRRYNAKADIEALKPWLKLLGKQDLQTKSLELSLEDRMALRLFAEATRHQTNRETIASLASATYADEARPSASDAGAAAPIEPEWLDKYWRHAEAVYSADFQSLWARILARQMLGKEHFSPRCLETLSLLTAREAQLLTELAPKVISAVAPTGELRRYILFELAKQIPGPLEEHKRTALDAASKHIRDCLGDWHEQVFSPIGIFGTSMESAWHSFAAAPFSDGVLSFSIANVPFRVTGYPPGMELRDGFDAHINIGHAIPFSHVGSEIVSLIEATPDSKYIESLANTFGVLGLTLERSNQ